ncbi:MAG: head maturation protease, ClpP-related [Candidatus Neomarinimicrobiota bacterium]|jgi:ATP-dependent Clp protease protease subunit
MWKFVNKAATETEPESTELRINGEIVDDDDAWIYEWFGISTTSPNAFRDELKKYEGKNITVWIDSYGGNVFAAAGIYNALMEHKGSVTVKIDGKAMSAASVIAMAGEKIYMSPAGMMMIHNPLTEVYGYASDLRKVADILDEVKESIMNAYEIKTNRSREDISAMMDEEKYMSSKTAIEEGFADEMLYSDNAKDVEMAFSRHAIMNSTTEAIKRMVAIQKSKEPPKGERQLAIARMELELTI